MNNQIKVVLPVHSTQIPSHMICFIWRTRNMHFHAIWSKEMSYSLPSMMA
jgi:hypothetical protein